MYHNKYVYQQSIIIFVMWWSYWKKQMFAVDKILIAVIIIATVFIYFSLLGYMIWD